MALVVKNLLASAGGVRDMGSIPGSGRLTEVGNGNPLQYSCLGNPMNRGAWQDTVHRVTKSWTRPKWLSTDCSMPGFPVLHYLPDFAQTRVHWVDDAIQPSHPLSAPSPLALSLSQHQGLFQLVSSLHQVAKAWRFSFNISPFNEYSGLISFQIFGR